MHDGVGRAAHGEAGLDGVADRAVGDDLTRGDVLFDQLHDLDAGFLCLHHADCRNRRGRAVARQRHADRFGQAVHRVCGVHTRARAAARAGGILQSYILRLRDLSGGKHTISLGGRGLVGLTAVELNAALHRAAGEEDARNIQSSRRHQHTRNDLVARAEQNQTVEQVDLRHGLDGIGDQLAGGHDEVHAVMSLPHAVAAADDAELNGRAACAVDAVLDALRDLTQVVVAGHALAPGVRDADERALEILGGEAHGLVGGAVILVSQTSQNVFTAIHICFLLIIQSLLVFFFTKETPAVS